MADPAVSSENSSAPLSRPSSSVILPSAWDASTIDATSCAVYVEAISERGS